MKLTEFMHEIARNTQHILQISSDYKIKTKQKCAWTLHSAYVAFYNQIPIAI